MPRHIHIPQMPDWTSFLANSAEIDNYLVSENELLRVRTSPAPRQLALAMTNCCNEIWNFVTAEEPISIWDTAQKVNETLRKGAAEELGLTDEGLPPDHPAIHIVDKKTYFTPSPGEDFMEEWKSQFELHDAKALDFLERGFSPLAFQKEIAVWAWQSQFWIASFSPFFNLNGMTGRFMTNAVRLRWSMPLWRCDTVRGAWRENLQMYTKFWMKKGPFHPLPDTVLPNVEKLDLVGQSEE
jgi:hypothetical protein